jgi:hypothetical protein
LNELGYAQGEPFSNASVKRFQHRTGAFQLWVIESGDIKWSEWTITCDYLLHNTSAREQYTIEHAQWSSDPARKEKFFHNTWIAAQQWWIKFYGFGPLQALVQELSDLRAPWYISSGWALDLYLGRVTRVHQDLDVGIAYADQLILRDYMTARGWKFVTPFDKRLEVWQPHTRLELPRHQAHAHRDGAFLDFLLTDIKDGVWKYRREPSIVQSLERITMKTDEGIPFLAPEVVLLFKSRNTSNKERPKDQTDFEMVVPHLEPERRAWLRWALLATNPTHSWIDILG